MNNSIFFLFGVIISVSTVRADKQEITMNDQKSISIEVSQKGISCLSVKGDRIQEVLGLSADVTAQKDEVKGQLFLKGVKTPQHITILTEGGEMQDLVLTPTSSKVSTRVVLTLTQTVEGENKKQTSFPSHDVTLQECSIEVLKKVQLGSGHFSQDMARGQKEGYEIRPVRRVYTYPVRGEVYEVKKIGKDSSFVSEKDFFETGDVALSLSKHHLKEGETFYLYVVRIA